MSGRANLFTQQNLPEKKDKTTLDKSDTYTIDRQATDADELKNVVKISSRYAKTGKRHFVRVMSPEGERSSIYPAEYNDKNKDPYTLNVSRVVRDTFKYPHGATKNISIVETDVVPAKTVNDISLNIVKCIPPLKANVKIDAMNLDCALKLHLKNHSFCVGQTIYIPYKEGKFECKFHIEVTSINDCSFISFDDEINDTVFSLKPESVLHFSLHPSLSQLHLSESRQVEIAAQQRGLSLDFAAYGVGGNKPELERILRELFFSRVMPPRLALAYGVKHARGVLLFGPPGTGKTFIARVIAGAFTKKNVKVINGAELKNMYVGKSTENLRDKFKDAQADWDKMGIDSPPHIFIFEEFDALAPVRGTRIGSSGVDDEMVAQLLTIFDGVNELGNIIIIATTNRKELIDPALLRPGRLEVHVEIGLPDIKDRLEILQIMTDPAKKEELLDANVDLIHWQRKTINFTGAELGQLVRMATSYAQGANIADATESGMLVMKAEIKEKSQLAKIKQEHFERAFALIKPAFGIDAAIQKIEGKQFAAYDEHEEEIIRQFDQAHLAFQNSKDMYSFLFLISGIRGTGKTELAKQLAYKTGTQHIKMLTADVLLPLSIDKQMAYLNDVFANAKRTKQSVIILDDFESLLGADAELRSYSNILRLKFEALLKDISESDNKITVIATAKNPAFIKRVELYHLFNEYSELQTIKLTMQNVCSVLSKLHPETEFVLSADEKQSFIIDITIRQLVYALKKFTALESGHTFDVQKFLESLPGNLLRLDVPRLVPRLQLFNSQETDRDKDEAQLVDPGIVKLSS